MIAKRKQIHETTRVRTSVCQDISSSIGLRPPLHLARMTTVARSVAGLGTLSFTSASSSEDRTLRSTPARSASSALTRLSPSPVCPQTISLAISFAIILTRLQDQTDNCARPVALRVGVTSEIYANDLRWHRLGNGSKCGVLSTQAKREMALKVQSTPEIDSTKSRSN